MEGEAVGWVHQVSFLEASFFYPLPLHYFQYLSQAAITKCRVTIRLGNKCNASPCWRLMVQDQGLHRHRFLVRPLSLACRWLPSHGVLPLLGIHPHAVSLLPLMWAFMTSFNHNCTFKVLSLNIVIFGVRTSTCEF